MLNLINQIVARAKANRQRIVLPEGTEERTLKAANMILTDEVEMTLFYWVNRQKLMSTAKNGDWETSVKLLSLILKLLRNTKNMHSCCVNSVKRRMTIEEARKLVE